MKNKIVLFVVLLLSISTYAQKKKTATSEEKSNKSKNSFAKVDNLEVEVKNNNFQISFAGSVKGNESIIIKNVDSKFVPLDTKLMPFTANGAKLYFISWVERVVTKTDNKNEESTTLTSQIYDITTKTLIFVNTQLTSKITEKVFLDRLKNASETQERIHREGYELTLNPDGTVIQKNKGKEIKLVYDPKTFKYIETKKK
ncbi:MAG: hypothetical protein H7239_09810 [Flavobacterium sp.]|nr:hypothetical protein [Flavobacterium sp.]